MRTRLLLVLLAFSMAAVAAFATPLLLSTAAERTQQLLIARTADLDRFASLADQAAATQDTGQLTTEVRRYSELYGESVLVVDSRRNQVTATGSAGTGDPAVRALIEAALRNQPAPPVPALRPWSSAEVLLARPVGTGTRVTGAVVLQAKVAAAAADVAYRWAVILAGALAAAIVCAAVAIWVSRWVLRPVRELERGVHAVASGEPRAHVAVHGPSELRTVADAFNQMSDAVSDAADRQRRLVAEASHQLRNPMAALRLRVDALAAVSDGNAPGYRPVVAEVERLEALLDGLLALANADERAAALTAGPAAETSTMDSDELVRTDGCDPILVALDRVDAWRAAAAGAEVTLREPPIADVGVFTVDCQEPELAQVLDVVLDNAVKYAGPDSTVTVQCSPTSEPTAAQFASVLLVVSDDGPGLTEAELALATERFWRADRHRGGRGTGLGLAIAAQLITAHGGRLSVHANDPHGLAVHIELPGALR